MKKETPKMYIGPSVRRYGLVNGNIYIGNTGNLKTALKEIPELKHLFLDVDKNLMENKKKVLEEGTRENIIFKSVIKKIGGRNGI